MAQKEEIGRVFVSVYNKHRGGHNKDIEYVLRSTKRPDRFKSF